MGDKIDPDEIRQLAFSYYPRLTDVQKFCTANLAEDLTVETVAKVANLDKCYFSKFFHEKVGVTFQAWLWHLRITRAAELLHEPALNITQVATQVGFNELSTFERVFRMHMGCAPREYQAAKRNTQAGKR